MHCKIFKCLTHISSVWQLVILSSVITPNAVYGRWNDSYDLANLRTDYLLRFCSRWDKETGNKELLEKYIKCSKPGLSFPNLAENVTTAREIAEEYKATFHSWCLSWTTQRQCEKENDKYVDNCFSLNPAISVGWDFITSLFSWACQKQNGGENIAYLILFHKHLKNFWYNERDLVNCFNDKSLEYYKRDISLVLRCLKYELRYRNCSHEGDNCQQLLQILENGVKSSYSSSGYIYLTHLNFSLIDNEKFPLVSDLGFGGRHQISSNCQNGSFAYIAFFSLLAILVIVLGLLVSVKVKCIQSNCHRYQRPSNRHRELVPDEREGSSNIEI